jgi:transcriptional regulator with XRE-family HTH domain
MHPIERIRCELFKTTQKRFGAIAGVTQATVSRWESGDFEPTREQLGRIRNEARSLRLAWDDAWFFEPFTRGATKVNAP